MFREMPIQSVRSSAANFSDKWKDGWRSRREKWETTCANEWCHSRQFGGKHSLNFVSWILTIFFPSLSALSFLTSLLLTWEWQARFCRNRFPVERRRNLRWIVISTEIEKENHAKSEALCSYGYGYAWEEPRVFRAFSYNKTSKSMQIDMLKPQP